jgi:protein-tyrosine phosphatase
LSFLVNLFRRKVASNASPFDFLDVDIHNHILPGLDDGSQDATLSITLLVELKKLGFNSVISSPKTINQQFPNTPKSILRRYASFISSIDLSNRLLPEYIPPVSLYALDSDFSFIRKSGELLATADNYVLVQFVDSVALSFMEAEIIELIYAGFKPILIHPEQYISLQGNSPYFESLVSRGCQLSLSLLSLQGVYGHAVQKMAYKLLENQLYSFVGTGIKNQSHVKVLQNLASDRRIMKKLMEYPFENTQLINRNNPL